MLAEWRARLATHSDREYRDYQSNTASEYVGIRYRAYSCKSAKAMKLQLLGLGGGA